MQFSPNIIDLSNVQQHINSKNVTVQQLNHYYPTVECHAQPLSGSPKIYCKTNIN